MERALFGHLVVSSSGRREAVLVRKLPLSVAVHGLALAALLSIPSTRKVVEEVVTQRILVAQRAAPPATQPARPPDPPPAARAHTAAPTQTLAGPVPAPAPGPTVDVSRLGEGDPRVESEGRALCLTNCGGASSNGTGDGTAGPIGEPAASAPASGPVRPGYMGVQPPRKLQSVAPVYPELARMMRVEGVVVLDCTIGTDGRIVDVRVLSGPSLLQQAAVDAVRRWAYTPTLLNGTPVSVVMSVNVAFHLNR